MKVLVGSVQGAFKYAMDHYYPPYGKKDAIRKDTYAIISIQDTHTNGFGFRFCQSNCCKDVLTLLFDDVVREVDGYVAFNEDMAKQIIEFINKNKDVDTLVVHCYAGESRSRAVGAFAKAMLGKNNQKDFMDHSPNLFVYNKLLKVYKETR